MELYELNKFAKKIMDIENNRPIEDFEGLSSNQMHQLLYFPFEENTLVKFAIEAENNIFSDSCIFMIAKDILRHISDNKGIIKLTTTGNLPPGLVKSVYDKGYLPDYFIDKGFSKIRTETDWRIIHIVKLVLVLSGLVRKSHNKMSITKKGSKLLEENSEYKIYFELLNSYCLKFSWAYNDGYLSEETGQLGFMYMLYLLKKYGEGFHEVSFYSKKYFRAFPQLSMGIAPYTTDPEEDKRRCLSIRFFERFCEWFGLAEIQRENTGKLFEEISRVKKTQLFGRIIY